MTNVCQPNCIEIVNGAFKKASNGRVGGSPGLVVMGGGSRSEGRGFEFRCHILDGHEIFHIDLL